MVNMTKYYISAFAILFMVMSSCGSDEPIYATEPLQVTISHVAGDPYAYVESENQTKHFAPYPFHHAIMLIDGSQRDVFIIGKSVYHNAELGILPFEELDFEHENGEKSSVILAIPSDPTIQFLDYSAFLNDADKLYSYLHILEYWYTNRHGLNGTRLVNRRSVTYENY